MEEAPRETKPEEESSPTEDGSPLASEPKTQRISGDEEDGGGGGGGGAEAEEDVRWEATAANPLKDIVAFKEATEQNLKTSEERIAQLEANLEHIAQLEENFRLDMDLEEHISALKKGNQDVLNSLKQLIEIWEVILFGSIDEEPFNSSLPDDAEVDSPNNSQ